LQWILLLQLVRNIYYNITMLSRRLLYRWEPSHLPIIINNYGIRNLSKDLFINRFFFYLFLKMFFNCFFLKSCTYLLLLCTSRDTVVANMTYLYREDNNFISIRYKKTRTEYCSSRWLGTEFLFLRSRGSGTYDGVTFLKLYVF